MYKAALPFIAVLAAVSGQTTQVSQCTWSAGAPLPLNAELAGCVTPPCQLPQLQDALISLVFEAPYNIKSMRTVVQVSLSLGSIPMPPFPYDLKEHGITCNFLQNSYCPLQKGEIILYQLTMFIESFFQVGITATAEFKVIDEADSTEIACIRLPITIVEAVSSEKKMILATNINATLYN